MFSGFYLFLSVIVAVFTTLFAFVPELIENWKFRHHVPLAIGLFIVVIFLLINPQQEPGSLYWPKVWCQYFLLPLFIFAPLPYLRKWNHVVLSKISILLGAILAADFYFAFIVYGNYYLENFWQIDGLIWTAGSFILAFLIYLGISLCQKYLDRRGEQKHPSLKIESVRNYPVFFIMIIIWFAIFSIPTLLIEAIGNTESCGGFEIASLNQSQVSNSSVKHLTDQDFRNFPRMASFIRDNHTISGKCYSPRLEGNICVGRSGFRCKEEPQFRLYEDNILEYNGRYYLMRQTYVV